MERTYEDPIVEVVHGDDNSGCPRIMKWSRTGETLDHFDEPSTRYVLGKFFSFIRDAIILPRIPVPYGSTRELFDSVHSMLSREVGLIEPTISLVTYWTLMSWFADVLPLAPTLAIIGGEYEADLLLRALACVCRYPILLGSIHPLTARMLPTEIMVPTLLVYEPQLTSRMASLLATSKSPGYFVPVRGGLQDLYCPKAIYLGEHQGNYFPSASSMSVNLLPAADTVVLKQRFSQREFALDFQNRLLSYRINNYYMVRDSEFTPPTEFMPSTAAIAQVLAAVVQDDQLKRAVVPLLSLVDEQLCEARRTSLESVLLEAVLSFCHEQQRQSVLAREIAEKVNGIYENMGERLQVNEEKVGHALKRLGLYTRRLGSKGRGLELAKDTQLQVHELAHRHQGDAAWHNQPGCAYCQAFRRQPIETK